VTSVDVGMGRWPGRERGGGRGREWSEQKRVTDGILGLIWDFASSGGRGVAVLSGAAPLRVGPADLDQGPIKVELKLQRAFLTRSQTRSWARRACRKNTCKLRCTVQYCYSIQFCTECVSGKGKWSTQRRA